MNIIKLLYDSLCCTKHWLTTYFSTERANLADAAKILEEAASTVLQSLIDTEKEHSADFTAWRERQKIHTNHFKQSFTVFSTVLSTALVKLLRAQDELARNSTYRQLRFRKKVVLCNIKKVVSLLGKIREAGADMQKEMQVLRAKRSEILKHPMTANINERHAALIDMMDALTDKKSAFDDARDVLLAKDKNATDPNHHRLIVDEYGDAMEKLVLFERGLRFDHGLSIIDSKHIPLAFTIYSAAMDELHGVYARVIASGNKYIRDIGISAVAPVLDPQVLQELQRVGCAMGSIYQRWARQYCLQIGDYRRLFSDANP